jgi:hypothetical protein
MAAINKVIFAITTSDLEDLRVNQWGIETGIDKDTGVRSLGYRDSEGDLHRVLTTESIQRKATKYIVSEHCVLTDYTVLTMNPISR